MKREVCPNCGGVLVAESLGWKCKSCRGFISLQDGKFYEYVEKPFMPPQTNADRIRAMSDEELADKFTDVAYEAHGRWYEPDGMTYHSQSADAKKAWLDWLRKPACGGE